MSEFKIVRLKTQAASHIVIRNRAGYKIFEVSIPGVSISVAVLHDAQIQVDGVKNEK
jgi:hypothetical protein